jgi:hypothetical protein
MYVRHLIYVRIEAAMKTVTPTELRADLYRLLEDVLRTGLPLEIKKGDKRLRIVPLEQVDKFQRLVSRPEVIQGYPEDLVDLSWEQEVNLDLP